MNYENILQLLNSPLVISGIAAVVLWGLTKLYTKKPLWEAYEGTIISAVKWAEKFIDDDTENAGLKKLDCALKYVIRVYEEYTKKRASAKVVQELKEGVQIVHDQQAFSAKVAENITMADKKVE